MYKNTTISLVLPCRNEANALQAVFYHLPKVIDEIIVVNNGSTDATMKVAKKFGAKVFIEKREKNGIGYGYALATGIRHATGDVIVCMDGDGSYPVSEIPRLVGVLKKKSLDFISCSRFPFKDPKKMSRVRAFGVRVLNLTVGILYKHQLADSLTGMWVFKRSVVDDLTLFEGGWNFSLEIKLNAINHSKIKFTEAHIPYHDRQFDSSKQNIFQTGIEHTLYLFYFKLRFLFNNRFLPRQQLSLSLSCNTGH